MECRFYRSGQSVRTGRGLIAIRNPEPTAAIQDTNIVPLIAQKADQLGDAGEGGAIGREVEDLTADLERGFAALAAAS